jgi:hypothetical protein
MARDLDGAVVLYAQLAHKHGAPVRDIAQAARVTQRKVREWIDAAPTSRRR